MVENLSKFKKFDYIELSNLYVGLSNIRTENVTDEEELQNLVEHIGRHGLLEPIVVFDVNDLKNDHPLYESRKDLKNKFEILAGQRRYFAFKKLNNENPDQGWNKISCHIRTPPDDDTDAKAISLGEGLTQLPFTLADTMDACNALFKVYNDARIVAKKTGVSKTLVERYVKFARLPKLIQDHLDSVHTNPKTAVNLSVEASDALSYTVDGEITEEKVYELAKKLGEKKKKSQDDYKKLKQAAEENPEETIEKIVTISTELKNPTKLTIVLVPKTNSKLEDAAEQHGKDPEDEAVDLIEYGLDIRQATSED